MPNDKKKVNVESLWLLVKHFLKLKLSDFSERILNQTTERAEEIEHWFSFVIDVIYHFY